MNRFLAILFALLALGASACATERDTSPTHATTKAIVGAAIYPMDGSDVIQDGVVLIENDRIVALGARGEVGIPGDADVIDATGKYLVPGLVDMHTHLANDPGETGDATWRQLQLMVANGVTTARSMSGHPSHPAIRDAILAEDRLAPRLYVAAPAMHQGNTPDAATAGEKVRAAKRDGFDLVKSHHLEDLSTWQAVQRAAQEEGIAVAGHLASRIPLEYALKAGQQVEHLDGWFAALLPKESPARAIPFGQVPPPPVMDAIDRDRVDDVARLVVEHDGWNVPTLALFEKIADVTTPNETLRAAPLMRYVPEPTLDQWAARRSQLVGMNLMQAIGSDFVSTRRAMVAALHDAGGNIMAGSDTPQDFHLSGFALHDELRALQAAGLPSLAALATATANPRRYFQSLPNNGSTHGHAADFGVISVGQQADLLLLAGNPARDVAATQTIETVILRGRVLDRAKLDAMLEAVSASVAALKEAAGKPGEVILLRHAETEGHAGDPSLSAVGRERAKSLATRFAEWKPRAIYVTPTRRARETAEPFARASGAPILEYHPGELAGLAERLKREGGKVMVVGHTNTTPVLARMLGGMEGPAFVADEHDRSYTISLPSGATRLVRPARSSLVMEECTLPGAGAAHCGHITVQESDKSNARDLDIHFAVLPATGTETLPPLVIAPGGPGLGGLQSAGGIAQLFASFREDRALWLIDQRGTGQSNRLDCSLPGDLVAAIASLSAHDVADIHACRDALGKRADLSAYTTPVAVRDIEKIRLALGKDKIDMFGMSYGTRVALDYGRQFPDSLRAVIIRSPAPTAMQLPLHTPRDTEQALDNAIAACHAQPQCRNAFPDIRGDIDRVVSRLGTKGVNVEVMDPRNGQVASTVFTRDAFGSAMFFLLYIPEYYRQMPMLVHAAAEGNFQPLVQSVAPLIVGTLDQVAWGMRWSVICNEDVARIDRSRIASLASDTFLGEATIAGELKACDVWPDASIDEAYFDPPELEHPVLVISGSIDPVAPPRWGDYLVKTLGNAVHLPVEGASHLPVFPGCTDKLALGFLESASLDALDFRCAKAPQVPAFVVPPAS